MPRSDEKQLVCNAAARSPLGRRVGARHLHLAAFALFGSLALVHPVWADGLASVQVRAGTAAGTQAFDGTVQAVRQTVVAAQVTGSVVALEVKAGDAVKAGQLLLRIDARAAEQTAAAGRAQVQSARAAQQVAAREFERQKLLFKQNYISQAALDRAEAQFKATQAEVAAQQAGAGAALTTSGFYVVKAPYAGIVADVGAVLGDMAMPGKALLTLYDPTRLRVSVNLPQTAALRLDDAPVTIEVELPGLPIDAQRIKPTRVQLLPSVDTATHTQELRLELPTDLRGVAPGTFARAWVPAPEGEGVRLYVPQKSILHRAELTGLYVIGSDGRPSLRQVRLGRSIGDEVEVLAGVDRTDRVALDPQAAARVR